MHHLAFVFIEREAFREHQVLQFLSQLHVLKRFPLFGDIVHQSHSEGRFRLNVMRVDGRLVDRDFPHHDPLLQLLLLLQELFFSELAVHAQLHQRALAFFQAFQLRLMTRPFRGAVADEHFVLLHQEFLKHLENRRLWPDAIEEREEFLFKLVARDAVAVMRALMALATVVGVPPAPSRRPRA